MTAARSRRRPTLDLAALLPSWEVSLRADHKSRETLKSYTTGMYQFLDWCEANDHTPALEVADLLAAGLEASTFRARQLGVRRFSAWCEEEGEVSQDPLLGLKAPKLDLKLTESLTDDQVRALVKACSG